ncbi:MAG TPA: nodulation protein NfeD [Vicinamibacteria bacterium]|nr:nodulation protein NfeD [Vicinamibacteria bacterium]
MSALARVLLLAASSLVAAKAGAEVPVVELDGVVHAITAAHVVQAIERADAGRAPLVVIRMDTPGGLESSMRQIADRVLNAKTPVAVFVGPAGARAASAGFVIAMAADVVAMAPGTNMGAAHPVPAMGGGMDEVMAKKVAQDAAASLRSRAARRGRNAELAEKAVFESRSFTEKEALDARLCDLVVKDVPELLAALEGREVTRFDGTKVVLRLSGHAATDVRMGWRQMVLAAIATPQVLFLLLLGALAGIGGEMSHPGALFPGIVGVLCLVLFLFAAQIIPVNWAGVLLIVLAIGLFAAEVKVASYGLLTVSGLVAMILGAMMLVDAPAPELRVPLRLLLPAAVVMAAGTILLIRLVVRAQRSRPVTGREGLVGQSARADTDLAPEGWVVVMGERWRGRAEGEVRTGDRVTVVGVEGLTLRVRKGA